MLALADATKDHGKVSASSAQRQYLSRKRLVQFITLE
jgi:hypothetical protein